MRVGSNGGVQKSTADFEVDNFPAHMELLYQLLGVFYFILSWNHELYKTVTLMIKRRGRANFS